MLEPPTVKAMPRFTGSPEVPEGPAMQVVGQGTENATVSAMALIPADSANARTVPANLENPNVVRIIIYSLPGATPKDPRRPSSMLRNESLRVTIRMQGKML